MQLENMTNSTNLVMAPQPLYAVFGGYGRRWWVVIRGEKTEIVLFFPARKHAKAVAKAINKVGQTP